MTDNIDYVVINEDGKDDFQCNHCEAKFSSQKSIRTHVTAKHKAKATKKPPTDAKGLGIPPTLDEKEEESEVLDLTSAYSFENLPKSTQVQEEGL